MSRVARQLVCWLTSSTTAGLAHPFWWSLAANLTSSSLGLTSRMLFGWP